MKKEECKFANKMRKTSSAYFKKKKVVGGNNLRAQYNNEILSVFKRKREVLRNYKKKSHRANFVPLISPTKWKNIFILTTQICAIIFGFFL